MNFRRATKRKIRHYMQRETYRFRQQLKELHERYEIKDYPTREAPLYKP